MALVEVEAAAARESSGWLSAPKRIKSSQLASSPRLYPAVMPSARGPRRLVQVFSAPRRGVCAAELHDIRRRHRPRHAPAQPSRPGRAIRFRRFCIRRRADLDLVEVQTPVLVVRIEGESLLMSTSRPAPSRPLPERA